SYRQGFDRQRGGLPATGTGKDTGIGNKQIAPAMAPPVTIDYRLLRIVAHPAGAKHVGGVEEIIGAVFLKDVFHPRREQYVPRGLGHEFQAAELHVTQITIDTGQWDTELIPLLRIK